MSFPTDLYYTNDHEWIRIDAGGGSATVGITEFAQRELGDIVYVDLEPDGTELKREEKFGSVEAVKTVSDLLMPVTGIIIERNAALDAQPELVNTDPYGEGWLIRLELLHPDEVNHLLAADQYGALVS
jgi:glycine cleavage system H protein